MNGQEVEVSVETGQNGVFLSVEVEIRCGRSENMWTDMTV